MPRAEDGDAVALVGDNRRMLIVKIEDIPLMTRGRGVILQRYRMGGLAYAKVFRLADGLSWKQGENRTRTETDLTPWLGPPAAPAVSFPTASPGPINSGEGCTPCQGRAAHVFDAARRCRSSVVEHPLGKGEVVSSILTGSTIRTPLRVSDFPALARLLIQCVTTITLVRRYPA